MNELLSWQKNKKKKREMHKYSINHFSHPNHSLKLYKGERKPWSSRRCVICSLTPSECMKKCQYGKQEESSSWPVYGCRECRLIIHLDCAKLPQELIHPFHPHHPLSLYYIGSQKKKRFPCHACADYHSNELYVYRCTDTECKFNLDIRCIQLQPLNNDDQLIISHQHHVFVCNQPTGFESRCSFCRSRFSETDLIYVCVDCKHLLHESCVFPQETTHPFHLEHPLVLVPPPVPAMTTYKRCNACTEASSSFFTCSVCEFFLDLSCVHLKPTRRSSETEHEQPLKQPHSLIQCDPIKDRPPCSGCESPIKDSVYVCLERGILLDKSCSTQLLPEITSPFHPLHPLTLVKHKEHTGCRICHRYTNLLKYVCRQCNFVMDTRCAASTKPYAMVNSRMHRHSLAFMIKKPPGYDWKITCETCDEPCVKYFFSCPECYYCIHLECCPSLPLVVKHDSHCDPLFFTDYRIKDASDEDSEGEGAEFYCHACENLRDLDDPTYYCEKCHFVAHLQCVFPAILHGLEAEFVQNSPRAP